MSQHLSQIYQQRIKIITIYITFISFLSIFKILNCQYDCSSAPITNINCLNNVLKFNNKKYKAGTFAKNKNGDIFIEFSEDSEISSSRLFYGLTKDGKYFFSNQSSSTKELDINIDNINTDYGFYNSYGVYNSLNLFVSLKNDPNKGNQYLFSINSFHSIVELFNINDSDENINYYVWNFNDFFKINEEDYNFLYDYVLYEINKDNSYLIIIIPKFEIYDDIINLSFIKKFRFKSFDKNAYEEINYISYKKYLNSRIINTFFMDDHNTLVVLSCFEEEFEINEEANEGNIDGRRVSRQISSETYFKLNFNFSFYNHNLKLINYVDGMIFNSFINENTNDDFYFDIHTYSLNQFI